MKIAIYGESGAGKDTSANYLHDEYGFNRLRLAYTIKAAITESEGISFEELEIRKRTEQRLRDAHHEFSDKLGNQKATMNRIKLIANKQSMDFQLLDRPDAPMCILDCRSIEEIDACIENGFTVIMLTKRNKTEYKANHYTEVNLLDNHDIVRRLVESGKVHVIDNNIDKLTEPAIDTPNYYRTDGSVDALEQAIDVIISKLIDKKHE